MRKSYFDKIQDEYSQIHRELAAIARELGEDWRVVTHLHDNGLLEAYGLTDHEISIHAGTWTKGYFEFSGMNYPEYIDTNGEMRKLSPRDIYGLSSPETKARRDRKPAAIAKQIKTKLFPGLTEVFNALRERADSYSDHAGKTMANGKRVADMVDEDYRPGKTLFYGEGFSIDQKGSDSFNINGLSVDQLAKIIPLL